MGETEAHAHLLRVTSLILLAENNLSFPLSRALTAPSHAVHVSPFCQHRLSCTTYPWRPGSWSRSPPPACPCTGRLAHLPSAAGQRWCVLN